MTEQKGSTELPPTGQLIDQLEYTSLEIASLGDFLANADIQVVLQRPVDGGQSINDGLATLLAGQQKLASHIGLKAPEAPPDADPLRTIELFVASRRELVALLRNPTFDRTSLSALDLGQAVLQEAELLRDITVRLHESNMFRL